MFNWFVHRFLRQPYRLYLRVDQGHGKTVVLLHGIASSGESWRPVVAALAGEKVRVIVLDLLGFGQSPKPTDTWVTYSARDHARAVIRTLESKRLKSPVVLAGHSMGCLVAVEIAALRPDLVQSLILYEPPFYEGLPATNAYRLRLATYFALYHSIIKRPPVGLGHFAWAQKLVARIAGFEITQETWVPFQRSMKNAIMSQTALNDLKRLKTPTQILYGRYDQVVINDKKNLFFGDATDHVMVSEVPAQHIISPRASKTIADVILQAITSQSL